MRSSSPPTGEAEAVTSGRDRHRPWWHRPGPSLGLLAVLIAFVVGVVLVYGGRMVEMLPDVGLDETGIDTWVDPLAVQELPEGLLLAIIPDCAADPITRIVLWDARSEPLWEVSGPPRPVTEFFVGNPIDGFETRVELQEVPDDELVRLVVFRRVGPPVGLRYRTVDLASGKVMGGSPLRSYTREGWADAGVCPGAGEATEEDPADSDGPADVDDETDTESGTIDEQPGSDTDPSDFDDVDDTGADDPGPDDLSPDPADPFTGGE